MLSWNFSIYAFHSLLAPLFLTVNFDYFKLTSGHVHRAKCLLKWQFSSQTPDYSGFSNFEKASLSLAETFALLFRRLSDLWNTSGNDCNTTFVTFRKFFFLLFNFKSTVVFCRFLSSSDFCQLSSYFWFSHFFVEKTDWCM